MTEAVIIQGAIIPLDANQKLKRLNLVPFIEEANVDEVTTL